MGARRHDNVRAIALGRAHPVILVLDVFVAKTDISLSGVVSVDHACVTI